MRRHDEHESKVILIKGAGEKASAVAHCLYRAGFPRIVMTDLPVPRAERRAVCFCEAIIDWRKEIQGVVAERAGPSIEMIDRCWAERKVPVVADPKTEILPLLKPDIFVDALMAKRNRGTTIRDAALVIALGPGFMASADCHFVIETNPGSPNLGRVISAGQADENTGMPTSVLGLGTERILRSPAEGRLVSLKGIGDRVERDEIIGYVASNPIMAPISGCIWGLVRDGIALKEGQKIGDIDPRGRRDLCFQISSEAGTIAENVLKAIDLYDS
jgi:xanthine dehydrogenase accessory factor